MRNALIVGIAVILGTALTLAQDHQNATEKTVKQTIAFSRDTQVGGVLLKAGEYRVICDRVTIAFQSRGKTLAQSECKGKEMTEASSRNEVHTSAGPNGTDVLTKLLLKGSNVEHVFQ